MTWINSLPLLKVWKYVVATLAFLELCTCFYWNKNGLENCIRASDDDELQKSTNGFAQNQRCSGRDCQYETDWRVAFNRVFLIVLFIDAIVDSWNGAFSFLHRYYQETHRGTNIQKNDRESTETRCLHNLILLLLFISILAVRLLCLPLASSDWSRLAVDKQRVKPWRRWIPTYPDFPYSTNLVQGRKKRRWKLSFNYNRSRNSPTGNSRLECYPDTSRVTSFIDVVLIRLLQRMKSLAAQVVHELKVIVARRIAKVAFTRPWRLRLCLSQIFLTIRWVKFLAPLLGTLDKLRDDLQDLARKWILRRRKRRASRAWSAVIHKIVDQNRQVNAILRIQEKFREDRECQVKWDERPLENAESTERPRPRRCKRRAGRNNVISSSMRREANEVRQEIRRRERENWTLLLKPNTQFSVRWKMIKIACVLLEIAQSIFAPYISGKMEQMKLSDMMLSLLSPNLAETELKSGSLFRIWSELVRFLVALFVILVQAICFLDVFITFFTGELDSNWTLVPKPFFKRWLVPGVALQLLINPTMNHVAELVSKIAQFADRVGPSRVILASFALGPVLAIPWNVWVNLRFYVYSLVQSENRKDVSSSFNRHFG